MSPTMNVETVREWLVRQPFEQFELRLSNGEIHQVRHPELAAIGRNNQLPLLAPVQNSAKPREGRKSIARGDTTQNPLPFRWERAG